MKSNLCIAIDFFPAILTHSRREYREMEMTLCVCINDAGWNPIVTWMDDAKKIDRNSSAVTPRTVVGVLQLKYVSGGGWKAPWLCLVDDI